MFCSHIYCWPVLVAFPVFASHPWPLPQADSRGSNTLFLSSLRGGNRETHLSARTGSTKTPKVCWDYCKTEKLSWKGKHPSGPNIGNPFCPLSFSGVHRLAGTSGEVVLLLSLTMSNSKQPLLATHCLYISGSTGPLVFTTWLFKHLEQ